MVRKVGLEPTRPLARTTAPQAVVSTISPLAHKWALVFFSGRNPFGDRQHPRGLSFLYPGYIGNASGWVPSRRLDWRLSR